MVVWSDQEKARNVRSNEQKLDLKIGLTKIILEKLDHFGGIYQTSSRDGWPVSDPNGLLYQYKVNSKLVSHTNSFKKL